MKIKEINRNIRFDTRNPKSPYRCKYVNRENFDILRINISFNGRIEEIYEIESKFLPKTDSISFKAKQQGEGFKIFGWTAVVAPYIHIV